MHDPDTASLEPSSADVVIDDWIRGVFVAPPACRIPGPAVVLFHGFASDHDEVGGMFHMLADALVKVGIASLRIDFVDRGCADPASIPPFPDQIAMAETALGWLGRHHCVDASRVGTVGFSLGGAVAVELAARAADEVAAIVLWSAAGDVRRDLTESLGHDARATAIRDGRVVVDLGFRSVSLRAAFFAGLEVSASAEKTGGLSCPIGIIYGEDDPLVRYRDEMACHRRAQPTEARVITGTGHLLGALDADPETRRVTIGQTVRWLAGWLEPFHPERRS